MTRIDYRYDECGLDNVILVGLECCQDDGGETVVTIPNVNQLHRALLEAVSQKPTGINPAELKFIRTELGMTQAELAGLVGKDAQTIGRWERGEYPIEPAAETLIRFLALQHVAKTLPAVEEVAGWSRASAGDPPILIDASDPRHYRQLDAAAA